MTYLSQLSWPDIETILNSADENFEALAKLHSRVPIGEAQASRSHFENRVYRLRNDLENEPTPAKKRKATGETPSKSVKRRRAGKTGEENSRKRKTTGAEGNDDSPTEKRSACFLMSEPPTHRVKRWPAIQLMGLAASTIKVWFLRLNSLV